MSEPPHNPPHHSITVRLAKRDDAEQATTVLRRSIRDLCQLDYLGQHGRLERWLANKTIEQVHCWIEQDGLQLYVAETEDGIVAVGALSDDGVILLNYVDPLWRFKGVSSKLLATMEVAAVKAGHARIRLESTKTAERFYRARGYRPDPQAKDPNRLWMTKPAKHQKD